MCHELGEMDEAMLGGNVMVGVGFFGIDSEVWDVHLGEDIVRSLGCGDDIFLRYVMVRALLW